MTGRLRPADSDIAVSPRALPPAGRWRRRRAAPGFLVAKRSLDLLLALLAMPLVAVASLALVACNPIWNPGPLLYAQKRMGRGCLPFRALKFRTMRVVPSVTRGPDDPLETDRITPLGHFLRRTRIDELPQFLNVLVGQMSVVGPRPDYWDHAIHYMDVIPGYRQRHALRPGITGLAQVDGGYAEGIEATVLKTRHDLRYLEAAGFRTDWYVLRRTVRVVVTGVGAR